MYLVFVTTKFKFVMRHQYSIAIYTSIAVVSWGLSANGE